jgi:hypothetical protein
MGDLTSLFPLFSLVSPLVSLFEATAGPDVSRPKEGLRCWCGKETYVCIGCSVQTCAIGYCLGVRAEAVCQYYYLLVVT